VGRSATREAVEFYEGALGILDGLPETPDRLSTALDILVGLGPALITLKSAAAPEVDALYARGLTLVERLGDTSRRFPVLWGRWFIDYNGARYERALASGQRLLDEARSGGDSGHLVEAHHALWPTLLAMGNARAAVPYMEQGIALYDREPHAAQASLYAGHDPGACGRYQLAIARWLLGHPDRALEHARDAQRLAEELRHPQTMTIALWFTTWLQYQRGERQAAAETARRLEALIAAHGYVPWSDLVVVALHGPAAAQLDAGVLADVYRRLALVRTAAWRRALCRCIVAELALEAGHPAVARTALAAIDDVSRGAMLASEIRRLEGELRLREDPRDAGDAERAFRDAVAIARRRGERSLELRAETSLARVLAARDPTEARSRLAAVYGWFTEGLDTRDARAARALLAELDGPR
jgi:uncharacterized small protein (DUF1192 family)